MSYRSARRQLNRIELIIAVVVLSALVLVFLRFVTQVQARAESAQVAATIANLSSHLNIVAFHHLIRGDWQGLAAMQGMNPLHGLETDQDRHPVPKVSALPGRYSAQVAPVNIRYLGERNADEPASVPPGHWVFDTGDGCLVYYLRFGNRFQSQLPGAARIRLEVKLVYEDNNQDMRFDQGDQFSHVALVSPDTYRWQ